MSIIYDALKKAEKGSAGYYSEKKESLRRGKLGPRRVLFFTSILGVFVISFFIAYNFFGIKEAAEVESAYLPEALLSQEEEVLQSQASDRDKGVEKEREFAYNLEGIILAGGSSYVIIDGRVLYKEDKIDDFIVSEIRKDSVELTEPESGRSKILSISF